MIQNLTNFFYIRILGKIFLFLYFFQHYVTTIIDTIYKYVGFEERSDDSNVKKTLRVKVLRWACELGHEDCVRKARDYFRSWQETKDPDSYNPIPKNMRRDAFCLGVRYGHEQEWNFLWDRYRNSNVAGEKADLLYAMGCTRERWLIARYLRYATSRGYGIRKQDVVHVFHGLGFNPIAKDLVFQFYIEHWRSLHELYV